MRRTKKPKNWGGGRPKLYSDRIVLPLAPGVLEAIDAALGEGEIRLDLIRTAIERELQRRRGE